MWPVPQAWPPPLCEKADQQMTNEIPPTVQPREGDVRVERDGGVLIITLNRPAQLNALTRPMIRELAAVITAAGEDSSVRAMVFTGEGRGFCSGADARRLRESAALSLEERLATRPYFTPRMCKVFKPSICAVNGICAGAGLHFVADCDIVIASQAAEFTDTHVNIGQVTALEPIGLSRRMNVGALLRMMVLGKAERLSASQALAAGMISEVLAPDRLLDRAMELAALAATGSPRAVSESLRALWESFDMPIEQAYDNGYEILARHRDHPDATEGPTAFLEKRDPVWGDDAEK
jgi:enoyl-CoA hydratase/carnithine racemase